MRRRSPIVSGGGERREEEGTNLTPSFRWWRVPPYGKVRRVGVSLPPHLIGSHAIPMKKGRHETDASSPQFVSR